MKTIDRLTEELFEASFGRQVAAIVGDQTWMELMYEMKSLTSFHDPRAVVGVIRLAGCEIVSNGVPGTTGWMIGRHEDIVRMRDAIYAAQYVHVFKDTPEGRLHGAYRNENLGMPHTDPK